MAAAHSGGLELTWTNKEKALLSTGDGKYDYTFVDPADYRVSEVRLLQEIERVEAPTPEDRPEGLPEPTTDNLLITGDAMHVLDVLTKVPEFSAKYVNQVKLVYIDPPFNTGQAFDHYEDNIEHSVWLTLLRDRLRQVKPLLSTDASVWVHLDDVEVHRCRAVMDEELGDDRFVATVVWEKDKGRRNDTDISTAHDYLLVYAPKGKKWKDVRNLLPRGLQNLRYQNPDNDPRGPWLQGDNGTAKSGTDKNRFEVTLPSGRVVTSGKNYWRFSPEALEQARAEGRVWFGRDGDSLPVIKRYLANVQEGLVPRTWWTADEAGHNQEAKRDHINKMFADVADPFDTPKPERLVQRIINISTNPGDLVLDFFAGSGTTAAVAHKMGRRWVTSELSPDTVATFTKPRLTKVLTDEDPRGMTFVKEREAAPGVTLPPKVSPQDAQKFQQTLKRVLGSADSSGASDEAELEDPADDGETSEDWAPTAITVAIDKELGKVLRAANKAGASPLTGDDLTTLLSLLRKLGSNGGVALDVTKAVRSALLKSTKTVERSTRVWHGGGAFTHLEVGPSMFESIGDIVVLAEWVTQGDLAKAMCAQLGVRYRPDGIFAGKRGRVRYVVLDGLVGESTVAAIVDQLPESQIVEVWATQIDLDAEEALRKARKGSRLTKIPEAVLDTYRRRAAKESPFKRRTASGGITS